MFHGKPESGGTNSNFFSGMRVLAQLAHLLPVEFDGKRKYMFNCGFDVFV
jgi:hypothetical protein